MASTVIHCVIFILFSLTVMLNIPVDARWEQDGVTVAGGHGFGDATNQFKKPQGLSIDDNQTMVIVDSWNHRVIQWKIGDTNGQIVAGTHGQGS
ncbi:unnamed protein product [Rotaria sordida]|uniref:Uncharacterized protein n=1 Tax=Rotaria sordida TaxID=392033 RepID=A0A815NBP7_9BILA|nr:unnamed protein product [Rotaria sordida]CAF1435129.1 unnamed protein product [Rotaria sordida]